MCSGVGYRVEGVLEGFRGYEQGVGGGRHGRVGCEAHQERSRHPLWQRVHLLTVQALGFGVTLCADRG